MKVEIHHSWKKELETEVGKEYFQKLKDFVEQEYIENTCFPPKNEILSAFNHATFDDVKVVILGQDPYHGAGQANGLCFSVNDGISFPPSLLNIFKEIENDLNRPIPQSGNLERWAKQGVLLLNATLTVRASKAGSHQNKGWEQFTDAVIRTISDRKNNVVFLLWGGYAKKKARLIDGERHLILTSGHPSPLSANRGYWFGNKHFSRANEYLKQNNQEPIEW